ncbi:GAF domain-containing sensor histidine kinase [Christiangramia echinicola]|uniref:histidine kinase n=1 Tax=Christiangramia echinicola TaxID=279359 RepID=A0A1H1RFP3_9FLAO|nr:GAF domain-containing sensor histidine kinase [Christiangramia echinicola]SDS34500.1 His Kinase A (phospho-acceptor) domain-containing protein [Christiangramia echinicola]
MKLILSEDKFCYESQRINALKKLEILDTPPDGKFDKITKLTAQLLDMPIAIITLVDTDRIWFKSRYGLDAHEIGRDPGLCASAILSDDLYLIENAKKDIRALANPLVAGSFGLRFYAAVPIQTKDGYNLGTLCVIDKKSRKLDNAKKELLHNLADIVMDQMDLRMDARKAYRYQQQLMYTTAHDLKNPLSLMPLLADMIVRQKDNPKAIEEIGLQIKDAGKRMNRLITELLESAEEDNGKIQLRLKSIDLTEMVKGIVDSNMVRARNKKQNILFHSEKDIILFADHQRLTEIIDNLINNAIKFSPFEKNIYVTIRSEKKFAVVTIKDEGQGLTTDDKKNLFKKFTSLSAKPTGDEISTGLGLSIVKDYVDAHNGRITAISEGKGKGSTFILKLPLSEN